MSKIASDFEAANPGAKVTIVTRGVDDHKTSLRVAAGSDNGSDIYFSSAGLGLGGEYVKAGLSLPLVPQALRALSIQVAYQWIVLKKSATEAVRLCG
jgi:ABC-type glycerol-3-phosphate transport system substrate-binding protein